MSRKIVFVSLILLVSVSLLTVTQEYPTIAEQIEANLEIAIPATESVIWHDDCNDTSSFPDLATWYNGAMGSIGAENGYIYATDYGSSTGEHGPVYYHTFEPAIPIDS